MMRLEWVGGGYAEYANIFVRKVVLSWLCFIWFVVPANLLGMILVAVYPPFADWYESRLCTRSCQTLERQFLGLSFVPSFRYMVSKLGDISLAICLTSMRWMPFYEADELGRQEPYYGLQIDFSLHSVAMVYVLLSSVGGVIEELLRVYANFFEDLELGPQLYKQLVLLLQAQKGLCHSLSAAIGQNQSAVTSSTERSCRSQYVSPHQTVDRVESSGDSPLPSPSVGARILEVRATEAPARSKKSSRPWKASFDAIYTINGIQHGTTTSKAEVKGMVAEYLTVIRELMMSTVMLGLRSLASRQRWDQYLREGSLDVSYLPSLPASS